jgi:signal transduction histidine kinase
MKLSIEMLRESGADGARLDSLEEEVDALDELVAELLVASRLDMGSAVLEPQDLDLYDLVDQGWRRATSAVAEEQPPLEVDIADDATALRADRAYARRIFGNLLENAVRYGAGEPISVTARRDGERVRITVADRGPGVHAKALDRIFDAFYRVDSSRSRKTGGTGLGLMIVQRAVMAHGGAVEADSPEEGGLAVTFDLPAA